MRISDWSSDVCSSDLIDAKYDRFVDAFGTDVASQRAFQNTPKWTLSGTLGAHIPVGDGAVDASTSLSYRSLTHQFEVPIPWLDQPGYTLWDANLRYSLADERYSIEIVSASCRERGCQYV